MIGSRLQGLAQLPIWGVASLLQLLQGPIAL
jgi:hypothetical protein